MIPVDFLEAAKLLAENNSPGTLRSAVSRAYYATFHQAKALAEKFGIALPKNSDCHTQLFRILHHASSEPVKLAATQFDSLRSARNTADYNAGDLRYESQKTVTVLVASAIGLFASIQLANDADREAMREYAQRNGLTVT